MSGKFHLQKNPQNYCKKIIFLFNSTDLPYSRLLSVSDDEKEFVTLEEFKTHHLADLGEAKTNEQDQNQHQYLTDQHHILVPNHQDEQEQGYNVYYDLNTQKSK